MIAYTDIKSCVTNIRWLSSTISLEHGVSQGCPLSPLLYCLVVETLGQAIRSDPSIEGISIPASRCKQSKVSQDADDTTLIFGNDCAINKAFTINIFENSTCSRFNGWPCVVNPAKKARAFKLRWVPRIGDLTCSPKWIYFASFLRFLMLLVLVCCCWLVPSVSSIFGLIFVFTTCPRWPTGHEASVHHLCAQRNGTFGRRG